MKIDDNLVKNSLQTAIDLSVIQKEGKKPKMRKFDESVDLIINLKDINLNDPKQRIDKEFLLPHEIVKNDKPNVCVIASEDILLEAKRMGLDTLSPEELNNLNLQEKKYKKKFVKKYDFFIVEDKLMRDVARVLARFMGPLGKMPKPFPAGYGIISSVDDLKTAVERYKRAINIQIKKNPILQVKVGKKSMEQEKLFENMKSVIEFLADQMPHGYNNFRSAYIKTTMGKSVKIDEDYLKKIGVKK
ncbi:MAG: 50S ribosomal protein L1 [Promethearchaeota archaeon]